MKLGKLSLVAVMALGTSAFAIDNVKVNGEAKLWYQTSEFSGAGAGASASQDFFDKTGNSIANVALTLGGTADLLQNVSGGVSVVALSTLGLENNLVGDTPSNKIKADGTTSSVAERVSDQSWTRELYLKYATKEFDVKIGRQELNTPLAFTEKWNVVDNTFEAAVAHAYVLPNTVLAAAWVGKHNAANSSTTVNLNGEFETFGTDGAYAFAAINKSIPETTVQAWYYDVVQVADAYWLQADTKVAGMVNLGAQYANMSPKASGTEDTSIYALKAAVDVAGFNVYAAYSSAEDSKNTVNFSNVATNDKSMIYTALGSIYMDGEFTTRSGTDSWKVGASTKMVPGVALSASYAASDTSGNVIAVRTADKRNAWDVIANGNIGQLGLTAIYTQFEIDSANNAADKTTDSFRVIASLKF